MHVFITEPLLVVFIEYISLLRFETNVRFSFLDRKCCRTCQKSRQNWQIDIVITSSIAERPRCSFLLSSRVTDKSFMKVYRHWLLPEQMRNSTPRLLETCWQRLKRWQQQRNRERKNKDFSHFVTCIYCSSPPFFGFLAAAAAAIAIAYAALLIGASLSLLFAESGPRAAG